MTYENQSSTKSLCSLPNAKYNADKARRESKDHQPSTRHQTTTTTPANTRTNKQQQTQQHTRDKTQSNNNTTTNQRGARNPPRSLKGASPDMHKRRSKPATSEVAKIKTSHDKKQLMTGHRVPSIYPRAPARIRTQRGSTSTSPEARAG